MENSLPGETLYEDSDGFCSNAEELTVLVSQIEANGTDPGHHVVSIPEDSEASASADSEPVLSFSITEASVNQHDGNSSWSDRALMVVASLIATLSATSMANPPGGVWQEDCDSVRYAFSHMAGKSIMATKLPLTYFTFLVAGFLAVTSSFALILIVIAGVPWGYTRKKTLMITSITSFLLSYSVSSIAITPGLGDRVALGALVVICSFMTVLYLVVTAAKKFWGGGSSENMVAPDVGV